jgi:DNA-binding Xre family transcriptional regulator
LPTLDPEDGKGEGDRFSTLDALCRALDCQHGDILEYIDERRTVSVLGSGSRQRAA